MSKKPEYPSNEKILEYVLSKGLELSPQDRFVQTCKNMYDSIRITESGKRMHALLQSMVTIDAITVSEEEYVDHFISFHMTRIQDHEDSCLDLEMSVLMNFLSNSELPPPNVTPLPQVRQGKEYAIQVLSGMLTQIFPRGEGFFVELLDSYRQVCSDYFSEVQLPVGKSEDDVEYVPINNKHAHMIYLGAISEMMDMYIRQRHKAMHGLRSLEDDDLPARDHLDFVRDSDSREDIPDMGVQEVFRKIQEYSKRITIQLVVLASERSQDYNDGNYMFSIDHVLTEV
ncbi:MAG: hypothetical protein KJ597_00545 [Nanoarchaeota archaeon]|nr:hypothetical protein [Nanoarchaeota archaeon]MBU1622041.1 hypothetical protein [Nanoarchaeota archaeon]